MININFRGCLAGKKWVLWHDLQPNVLKNHRLHLGDMHRTSVIVHFHAIMRWLKDELQGHSGWEGEEMTPCYCARQGFASPVKRVSLWLCSKTRREQRCLPQAVKHVFLLRFSCRMAPSCVCGVCISDCHSVRGFG